MFDCKNTFIHAGNELVVALGLQDLVIVQTRDCLLVTTKSGTQKVKEVVDLLQAQGRPEISGHREVSRPWGSYESLEVACNLQIKRLVIKPGAEISLQKHAHRSEHWVCVRGKARITRNEQEFDLNVNESTYVGVGDKHRIANPYDEPVHIIEIQCGDYLGEDDIERFADKYGRLEDGLN